MTTLPMTRTPTSSEYFIEKPRMPVRISLIGGEQLEGELCMQASARGPSALEDAPEFMNASDSFFPLKMTDGTTRIVAKSQVAVARVNRDFAGEPPNWFGEPIRVSVRMSDASAHEGSVIIENISPHPRMLDYLNRMPEAFITLYGPEGMTLLNRDHIAYVHPFDDGPA